MSNKAFWDLVKPFLSNKGGLTGNEISLVNGDRIVTDDQPCKIDEDKAIDDYRKIVKLILDKYKNHPSILAIVQNTERSFQAFSFHEVSTKDVWRQLKMIDARKSTGVDQIPSKLVHLASDELASPLTEAINCSIRNSIFPQNAKTAAVCPLDKGEPIRTAEKKYRPVSVLNTFSRFLKKFSRNNLFFS